MTTIFQTDFLFNPNVLKKRVSLFKSTLQEDEILKKSVKKFILAYKNPIKWECDVPITWERLSSGYRIISLHIERVEEILEHLKVINNRLLIHFKIFHFLHNL
jgi:hypothetical protein